MVLREDIERLRLEADTIITRYDEVVEALERARGEAGDHWESGSLNLTLRTPHGDPIDLEVDLDADPSSAAERRYDRASDLENRLERRRRVSDRLDPMPADPVAYLICYHLDDVEGNYPKSMAGHLSADRAHVENLCEQMIDSGLLERVESGTVKQRRVKAKQASEVRQHHTYYRLSREGDHVLRFLSDRQGRVNVLRQLPSVERVARHLLEASPDSPRRTAPTLDVDFESVRHCYRTLARIGLAVVLDGRPDDLADGQEQPPSGHTFYRATGAAEEALSELTSR